MIFSPQLAYFQLIFTQLYPSFKPKFSHFCRDLSISSPKLPILATNKRILAKFGHFSPKFAPFCIFANLAPRAARLVVHTKYNSHFIMCSFLLISFFNIVDRKSGVPTVKTCPSIHVLNHGKRERIPVKTHQVV